MEDGLGANDPYKSMNSGEDGITPDFLKQKNGGSAEKTLGMAEKAAQIAVGVKTGKVSGGEAGTAAKAGEKATTDGLKNENTKKDQTGGEEKSQGLYKGKKGQEANDDEPSLKMSKGSKIALKAALPILMIILVVGGLIALVVGLPIMMIGAIDYNLQKFLGFEETVGILEEQGEHVTAELAASGKMPKQYFNDLVANGIDVGQVTANGDFVRTDTYIANIENRNDLIASAGGFSYVGNNGELAMLFKGKVIGADDFVAAVESDPELYAAYSSAADIGAKYYYSQETEKIFKEMGISRGIFNEWESTGNYEEDEKSFFSILDKILNVTSTLEVGGAASDGGDKETSGNGSGSTFMQSLDAAADVVIDAVARNTKNFLFDRLPHRCTDEEKANGYGKVTGICYSPIISTAEKLKATYRAVQLLNSAVSSGEPFLSSLVFIAIEEPLQRARVDGDGPVNIVMNALTNGRLVSYFDIATGTQKETDQSILETENFRAVVGDADFSKDEAQNFGRDRVIAMTGQSDADSVRNTTVSTNGKANASAVVPNGLGDSADKAVLEKATSAVELATAKTGDKSNSNVFQSVIGGNRAIEGGSFISNTINMREIGALPSNGDKISEYHKEVEKVMARRAEAERATKSPFDIASPNTFLGSIAHNFAMGAIKNYHADSLALSAVNSVGDTTAKAATNLTGLAMADNDDDDYTAVSGKGCETVNTVGVEGDLYCTAHNTPSTKYMSKTKSDWDNLIDMDGFKDFVNMGMYRYATVGVKSAEVCEEYRKKNDSSFDNIASLFTNMVGLYDSCDEDHVPAEVATGAKYTFGAQGDVAQNELYSGFALYDKVRSLLTDEQSAVAAIREAYDKEHPVDNSKAGVIARISGMEKYEAEMVLAYVDYINEIANYQPLERYAFSKPLIVAEEPILKIHNDVTTLNLYGWYLKETEYSDLRTRNFVV